MFLVVPLLVIDSPYVFAYLSLNQTRLFVHVLSSIGTRSDSQTRLLLKTCAPFLFLIRLAFLNFFSPSIPYLIRYYYFVTTGWIFKIG